MIPARLVILNLARWLREYAFVWGVLSVVYSLTVTLLLQPILERVFHREIPVAPLWALICGILIVPGILEHLPLPSFSLRRGLLSLMSKGSFIRLYLRHELRRGSTWLTIGLTVLVGVSLPDSKRALWILAAQLPVQRALYSIHRWRGLALSFQPQTGASKLLAALSLSQVIQLLFAWSLLGLTGVFSVSQWLLLGQGALGAVLSASMVAMEGDSGRPWIVNFISLASGILGGYLCYASPWVLLLVAYLFRNMQTNVGMRLHSVEHLDEDTLIP